MLSIKYFSTNACAPCKLFKPIVLEVVAKSSIAINLEFIDVGTNPEPIAIYNLSSVPSLIYFIDNKEVGRSNGYMNKVRFEEKLGQVFNSIKL